MALIELLKCDICGKSHQSSFAQIPDYWFEFEYHYQNDIRSDKKYKIVYHTCSVKCFYAQLEKCIYWSSSHIGVKIAGMGRKFATMLLESQNVKSESESFESKFSMATNKNDEREEISSKKVKTYYLKALDKFSNQDFEKYKLKFPEDKRGFSLIYARWTYIKNKEKSLA